MSHPSRQRLVAGILMALAGSVSFALNLITARLAYDEGTDPFTVSLIRTGFLALSVMVLLLAMGQRIGVPRGQLVARIAIGLLMVGQLLTLATAIDLIPVGVTILIYYTYPFMISAIVAGLERKRPPARRLLAMLAATAGLAFVLGVDATALDWRGIVLTIVGAMFFAIILVWSGRSMAGQDSMVLSYQVMGIAALAMAAMAAAGQALAWPQTGFGWLMLAISALLFTSATLCLFGGIARIGPLRASLIDYGSPVWVIVFGILLLGEKMSAPQWAGGAVVIGAVFLDQIADLRVRRQSPSPYRE
jgi:drug/metabolite transporter (DMT)-like permease